MSDPDQNAPAAPAVGSLLDLGVGRPAPKREEEDPRDFDDGQDDALCWECGQIHDVCERHVGEECGRWRNGVLSGSCSKAGSEECDFECPYSR
jgi:hypothetical protein